MDRGPDSPSVLALLRDAENARSLKGNHERKHLLASRCIIKPALSQRLARAQFDEVGYGLALEYLESLPNFIDLPDAILAHGFWQPGLNLEEQDPLVLQGTMSGEYRLGQHLKGPWFEAYDGPKPLIVGHQDYLRTGEPLIVEDRVFCLDTGCCRGGRLTGLTLPDFRIHSVKGRKDYWGEQKARAALASQRGRELPQSFKVRRLLANNADDLTWYEARAVLETPIWTPALSEKESVTFRRVKILYETATEVLPFLLDKAAQDCGRILREISLASPRQEPEGRDQSMEFAKRVGDSLYGRLLHRARSHALRPVDAEQVFRTPAATLEAAEGRGSANG